MLDNEKEPNKLWKKGVIDGVRKGLNAFLWMIKIILPVSYLSALFLWLGVLQYISEILKPFMYLLGLPGMAAIPLIAGALSSVYAGIAAMSVLPFKIEEMILMANFILICHNMIQETVIQANSGIKSWQAIGIRLLAATITVCLLRLFIKTNPHEISQSLALSQTTQDFISMNISWALSTGSLCLKIFFIIVGIMLFLELLKAFQWIDPIVAAIRPFLKVMGLSQKVGLLWMTAVVFGLAYGGALIVEEVKNSEIADEELKALQLSIGINHSMVEDPTLFLPLGLPVFWLWVPRLITAMVATRLLAYMVYLKRSRAK